MLNHFSGSRSIGTDGWFSHAFEAQDSQPQIPKPATLEQPIARGFEFGCVQEASHPKLLISSHIPALTQRQKWADPMAIQGNTAFGNGQGADFGCVTQPGRSSRWLQRRFQL